MPPVALFNLSELEAAFRFLLPPTVASQAARRWFEMRAGELDSNGYFVYQDWHEEAGIPPGAPDAIMVQTRDVPETERESSERRWWASRSVDDVVDHLLGFSSLHFRLVALVSEDLFERMRLAEGLTLDQAERGRKQMRNIVAGVGRSA